MIKKYNNHYNNYTFNNTDKVCLPGIPVVSLTMTLPVSVMPGGSAAVPNFKFFCRWKKKTQTRTLYAWVLDIIHFWNPQCARVKMLQVPFAWDERFKRNDDLNASMFLG